MTASRQLGVALLIILLIWIIAYWRLFAPVIQAVDDINGLKMGPGDSVGTHPDMLPQTAGDNQQIYNDSEKLSDKNQNMRESAADKDNSATSQNIDKNGQSVNDKSDIDNSEITIPPPPVTYPYEVKPGDTMDIIAQQWFGSAQKWVLIAQENPTVDPMKLKAGRMIRLPAKDTSLQSVNQTWLDEILKDTIYVVSDNDTLSSIAKQFYHDATKWSVIYEANRGIIPNPDSIKSGIELKIPPLQIPAE